MKQHFYLFLVCLMLNTASMAETPTCSTWPAWFKPVCHRLHQTWTKGDNELFFTGYSWHNRYLYSKKRLNTYNELAWGSGLGKSFYDEQGDWHGLFAFAFLDSHKNIEPFVGYAFVKMKHFTPKLHAGIGYGLIATARPDILHNIPFPGILPLLTLGYQRATLTITYIPG